MIGLGISVCTGIAAFLLGDHDWLKALIIAVVGLALWLWAVVGNHLVRVPALIHLDPETEAKAKAEGRKTGWFGVTLFIFLVFVPTSLAWWRCSGHSLERERKDSLRHRTVSVAFDVKHYLENRATNHPPYANRNSTEPLSDEQKKALQADDDYDRDTFNYYLDHYAKTMVAIVSEYKGKGVQTGFLESGLMQRVPWWGTPGTESVADMECMQDLCKFQELAYRVDERDNRVDIP